MKPTRFTCIALATTLCVGLFASAALAEWPVTGLRVSGPATLLNLLPDGGGGAFSEAPS